jgi:class 3 adenylate cyclase/tetratricopeptide (TPR) repeat protein
MPKTFETLLALVEHSGHIVTKAALMQRVWPDAFVEEVNLFKNISALRQTLGRGDGATAYIETVPKRGYRFCAPVSRRLVALVEERELALPADEVPSVWRALEEASALAPTRTPLPSGTTAATDHPSPNAPHTDGEYKLVSVLCGGVAEAPALVARLGPEGLYRLLQTVVELAQEMLQPYAGTLLPPTSEGLMVVFGAPVAQEDHARRAVLAALELRQRVRDHPALRAQLPEGGRGLQIGLHSGLVIVGQLGQVPQPHAIVVGAPVQVALGLQQRAAPGAILLSATTYHLVQAEVRAEPCGTLAIAGSLTPVPVYTVQGLMQREAGVRGRGAPVRSPFVGRARELALLHDRLAAAVAGQGQVVGLVGEPGMGKSRLLVEFCRSVPAHQVTLYVGQCLSYGSATPYLPVLDLLRASCGIMPADGVDTLIEKVRGGLQAVGMAPDTDATYVLSLLGVEAGTAQLAGASPEALKAKTFATLRQLLLQHSQQHPLLLAVEDLQWIDPTSAEFFAALVERLPGAALLFLGTYRPGYRPPWLEKSYATQLTVPPLSAPDSVQLLRAVLQTEPLPAPLTQVLLSKAQGNPFFLEELAQTLVEQDGVGGSALQLPPTVHGVLAARIDRLAREDKYLLQCAAVTGMEVPVPLLQAITEWSEAALQQGLARLQAAEFLYETRVMPALHYTFKHALTQEVAYSSVLQERRRVLHARIVAALETLAGERVAEQVDRLAHHALRGEVWNKAVTYCQQASARAWERAAFREAVAAFEQALEALAHLPEDDNTRGLAIDLRLAVEPALIQLGEYGRHRAVLNEAEALARALDDRVRLGRVLAGLADVLRITGDPDGAIAAGRQALAFAAALGESAVQGQASLNLGQACFAIGDFSRAAALFRQNMEAAHRESDTPSPDVQIQSQAWLAMTLSALGAFTEGRRHGDEALRRATLAGRGSTPLAVYGCLGRLYLAQGDLEHAIRVSEQGLALCRASGNRVWLRGFATGLGYASALQGRLAAGRTLLEEGISDTIRTGALQNRALYVAWLREVCLLAGCSEEAWQYAWQALDLTRRHKERGNEALALLQLGVVHAHAAAPDTAQAEVHYREALALAEELGMRPLVAHGHHGLGRLDSQRGRGEGARAELSAAIALYRAMEMTFWLPQAETARAQVKERGGDQADAPKPDCPYAL